MAFLDRYQNVNKLRRINVLLQVLLVITFFGGLNLLAMRFFVRTDLTNQSVYSLSPETVAYLTEIEQPVRFIVTVPANSLEADEQTLFNYVHNLLREYTYAAADNSEGRITIEYVDVFKDLTRAADLAREYGLERQNATIVVSGERKRVLYPEDILTMKDGRAVAFKGEQAFTSALIEVATEQRPTVYFVVGHGEMRPQDVSPTRGLSRLAGELTSRNFALGTLDLSQVDAVPEDADLVVVVDPQGPLMPSEQEKLRVYLRERAGRVLTYIGPGRRHGLDELLFEWGLRSDDMVVLEQGSDFLGGAGNYLIRHFSEHPVTEILIQKQTVLVAGLCRPVRRDPGAPMDDRLNVVELMGSSSRSWAETAYRAESDPTYNPETDLQGPISLAAVAERKASSQLGINVPGGRLIVFGSGDLISNRRFEALGNYTLFFSTINWMLDRDRLLAIPPRPIERNQLVLSQDELKQVGLWFLALPAAVALLGLAVHYYRKI